MFTAASVMKDWALSHLDANLIREAERFSPVAAIERMKSLLFLIVGSAIVSAMFSVSRITL